MLTLNKLMAIGFMLLLVCLLGISMVYADSGAKNVVMVGAGRSEYNVSKTNDSVIIPVYLSSPAAVTVTVDYRTADFEAIAGTDYVRASGVLTFSPGETQKNITLSITGNDGRIWKQQKRFYLHLTSPMNAALNDTGSVTISIRNPGGFILSFDDWSVDDWYAARPIFNEYGVHPTFYVAHWDRLTSNEKSELRALQGDGDLIECHSLNHDDAVPYVQQHGMQDYINYDIVPEIRQMAADGFYPTDFSYPGGSMNETIDKALAPYFDTRRSLVYNINHTSIYYKWDGSRLLYAIEVGNEHNLSLASIDGGMERAKANSEVLMMASHEIAPNTKDQWAISTEKLRSILEYARSIGLKPYATDDLVVARQNNTLQAQLVQSDQSLTNKSTGAATGSSIALAFSPLMLPIGIAAIAVMGIGAFILRRRFNK